MTAGTDAKQVTAQPPALRLAAAFGALVALTIGELLVAGMAAERAPRITALAGLLITKVALVLSFFMGARKNPRASVGAVVSITFAAGVAVVLLLETMFRVGVR